ncbi:DUF4148 domain-containing protein [Paraburkholderia diazotrophica]|uniref:DUF4148 domain-containing protein n=1 Tax=Paraburkholderia diazotrophica TaxID=667676 RepID=A0A1H6ZSZ8_9BURK|nr:DUF4148 domain-containing protein [Paraburkholderia diazotrophica]SEJ56609.1 protein of unknown function [Paraburkholderia diazotrophica]
MKSLIKAVAVAVVFAVPALSFAQANQPVTRAQVRAELVQLENAGYRPGAGSEAHYPDELLAAQARVNAQNGAASGYGGVANSVSQSGRPGVSAADWNAMYGRP